MLSFLFWNINRKPLDGVVTELASHHDVDVLVLAECLHSGAILSRLNETNRFPFHEVRPGLSDDLCLFVRFAPNYFQPLFDNPRMTIQRMSLPAREEMILCAVHLPSKLYWTAESQTQECARVSREIRHAEDLAKHTRTVLVGDLNMNPFESGVVGATGLNATATRTVASRGSRRVLGEEYVFFYNPMWSHFGDNGKTTAGSYYYDASQHVNFYWNVFDQVMVRPELIGRFPLDQVRILQETPSTSLITTDGRPDLRVGSDHLPLLFKLDL